MAPKIKIPVRRTGRALAHLHSKPSPHTRLVPHFAGALRSPQIEMRSAHGWRQPELHFGEARTRFPASHEPPGGASREPCAHLRSKCASRMGGGSEFEKSVSIAKNNTTTMSWCYFLQRTVKIDIFVFGAEGAAAYKTGPVCSMPASCAGAIFNSGRSFR